MASQKGHSYATYDISAGAISYNNLRSRCLHVAIEAPARHSLIEQIKAP